MRLTALGPIPMTGQQNVDPGSCADRRASQSASVMTVDDTALR